MANGDVTLSWNSHPVRTEHGKTAIFVGVLIVSGIALFVATGNVGWALVGDAFLMLGLYDFLLPTTFTVDEWGVRRRTAVFRRARRWEELRSFQVDARGVLVSTFAGRSRMEAHRGIYLRFDGNRERVLAAIEARMARSSGQVSGVV